MDLKEFSVERTGQDTEPQLRMIDSLRIWADRSRSTAKMFFSRAIGAVSVGANRGWTSWQVSCIIICIGTSKLY